MFYNIERGRLSDLLQINNFLVHFHLFPEQITDIATLVASYIRSRQVDTGDASQLWGNKVAPRASSRTVCQFRFHRLS